MWICRSWRNIFRENHGIVRWRPELSNGSLWVVDNDDDIINCCLRLSSKDRFELNFDSQYLLHSWAPGEKCNGCTCNPLAQPVHIDSNFIGKDLTWLYIWVILIKFRNLIPESLSSIVIQSRALNRLFYFNARCLYYYCLKENL